MGGILKISEAAALALHAMIILTRESNREHTTKEIARLLNASEAHLSKVMQRLVRAGLVKSHRGPRGGFVLAKEPCEISLSEIYETVDGPIKKSKCLLGIYSNGCGQCFLGTLLDKVNELVINSLKKTTLSEAIRKS